MSKKKFNIYSYVFKKIANAWKIFKTEQIKQK